MVGHVGHATEAIRSSSRHGGRKRRAIERKFRLKKPIAEAGAVFEQSTLVRIEFGTPVAELVIGLDKDHAITIFVDLDTLLECPEWFEEVT